MKALGHDCRDCSSLDPSCGLLTRDTSDCLVRPVSIEATFRIFRPIQDRLCFFLKGLRVCQRYMHLVENQCPLVSLSHQFPMNCESDLRQPLTLESTRDPIPYSLHNSVSALGCSRYWCSLGNIPRRYVQPFHPGDLGASATPNDLFAWPMLYSATPFLASNIIVQVDR